MMRYSSCPFRIFPLQ